jgi:hypothetical protein
MYEIGIGCLGWRKGVGFVEEGANRDAGHQRCLIKSSLCEVSAVIARSASDEAFQFCMRPMKLVIAGLRHRRNPE